MAIVVGLAGMLSDARSAPGVTIKADSASQALELKMESASLPDVIGQLQKTYSFEVRGIEKLAASEPLTAEMKGTLHKVLDRLLRNRNYMIVRAPENAGRVERLVILDGNFGAKPSAVAPSAQPTPPPAASPDY